MSSDIEWKPISLFLVEYEKGDVIGKCLAWLCLSPQLFFVFLLGYLAARRDLHTLCLMLGILQSVSLNYVLKKVIKEPRPAVGHWNLKSYGMPSDHSQFTAFVAAYSIFMFYSSWLPNRRRVHSTWYWHVFPLIAACTTAAMMYSRVYLLYHTAPQVYCGACIGALFGFLWAAIVQKILQPFFPAIASLKISQWFLIRHFNSIPNSTLWEYSAARQEAEKQQKRHD